MPQLSGGLGTAASVCVMIVVIGCFSVLWSFIYYPMLKSWRGNEPGPIVEERMLPPKVREAMKMSTVRQSAQAPKRPVGRPPFHMEHERHAKREIASQGSSIMNLFMPVYTVVVVIFFIFMMTRIGWRRMTTTEEEEMANSNATQAPQCNCNMSHYPRKPGVFQKNRESLVNTSTYRALNHLGDGDPSRSITSFLNDMETFRSHVALVGQMKKKLERMEQIRTQKLAENSLAETTNEETNEKDEPNANEESHPSTNEITDDSNNAQETEHENAQIDEPDMPITEQETVEETQAKDDSVDEEEIDSKKEEKPVEEPRCSQKNKTRRRRHRKAPNASNTENVPPLKGNHGKRNKRKGKQNEETHENFKME